MMLIAAAEQSTRGWGGPIAIVAAVAVFWAIVEISQRVRKIGNSSPTPRGRVPVRINPQVEQVSDTNDTDPDTAPWWGSIVNLNGRRTRRVVHVLQTGSSLPDDDDIDLLLDDEDQVDEEDGGTVGGETLPEYVDRLDRSGITYAVIVRQAMEEYGVSEATAKRRIRDARDARTD